MPKLLAGIPVKEDVEYEDSIAESVRWLGFDWGEHRYHASDYYDRLYAFAEWFIEHDSTPPMRVGWLFDTAAGDPPA